MLKLFSVSAFTLFCFLMVITGSICFLHSGFFVLVRVFRYFLLIAGYVAVELSAEYPRIQALIQPVVLAWFNPSAQLIYLLLTVFQISGLITWNAGERGGFGVH